MPRTRLGDLSVLITSGSRGWAPHYAEDGAAFLRMANVRRESIRLRLDQIQHVRLPASLGEATRAKIRAGDILISITAELGKIGYVYEQDLGEAYVNQHLCLLRIDAQKAWPEFVALLLASKPCWRRFQELNDSGAKAGLNLPAIRSFEVDLPDLETQRRVAAMLRTWDLGIEKTERLLTTKAASFDQWSRTLLTGWRRLGRKRSNWRSAALTEATLETAARNGNVELDASSVMGVNKLHGMIPMKDHVRAADLSRYKIVRPEAFAYNPMRLNIGSIAQNHHGRDVLVSPDYVVFEARPDFLMPAYFDHLRRTPMWSRFVKAAGSGGVRVRIYYDDLADFVFELPPLDEQARIIEMLDTGLREIAILQKQRDALIRQKRGLMQKLLTGGWSVKVPESQEAAE